ncbi:hypothetical protein Leryth_016814 [Lithospermum erythrorhizon]|nr:hypothetical protein Leryth_016814 [Lithospermum erythrorhizon]
MGVAEQSKTTYMELQRKRVHRYVIFKIDENKKEVVVERTGGISESYDDFTNCQKSKIFFIAWSPSVSRIRSKMIYAMSKERFRRELRGVHFDIQATDPTELELDVLTERTY